MSTSSPPMTGRREERGDKTYLVLERTFRAPIADVWAAVTEPDRLVRWIGTWDGDPASGSVQFRMTAEAEDAAPEPFHIRECEPPRRLVVDSTMPYEGGKPVDWRVELDLRESDGVTTLVFSQSLPEVSMAENVGPGWEYYLDRLVVTHGGGEASSIDWDTYYPSLSEPYARAFGS